MKIKKEYILITTFFLFILSYVLEYVTGNIILKITGNPYNFLIDKNNLSRIPLTIVEICVKSVSLFLSFTLLLSLFNKKYLQKFLFVIVFSALSQLYAIQQIMTKTSITSMQWTLAISYSGILILILGAYYFIQFIVYGINDKLIVKKDILSENETKKEESILNPK